MKKSLILIVIGLLLLFSGTFLYFNNSGKPFEENETKGLSREDAASVASNLINDVIRVYEKTNETFSSSEEVIGDKALYKLNNYSEVVKKIFSDNGIKQLESVTFDGEKFITKIDNDVYALTDIPINSRHIDSKINIEQISIKENEISCEVTFYSYYLDDNGVVNYYFITETIKLVKVGNSWLVDSFNYSNE